MFISTHKHVLGVFLMQTIFRQQRCLLHLNLNNKVLPPVTHMVLVWFMWIHFHPCSDREIQTIVFIDRLWWIETVKSNYHFQRIWLRLKKPGFSQLVLFCFAFFFFFPLTNQSLIDIFFVKKYIYILVSLGRLTIKIVFISKTFIEYHVLSVEFG